MRYLRSVVDYIDSLEAGDTFRRYFSFGLKFSGVLILSVSILGGSVFLYSVRETPSLLAGAIHSKPKNMWAHRRGEVTSPVQ